jgi:cobalt-zinc-cadmium efflux system membrane fusion protein
MNSPTILLVDDDETLSRVLRRVLTREGYAVVEAGDVARALQAARETPPQLGLIDLRLPDGDGVELARKLVEQGMSFPVILMTAYPLRLRDQPELARQFARVLTKPLNLKELREVIEALLAQHRVPAAESTAVLPKAPTHPEIILPPAADTPAPVPTAPARRNRAALIAAGVLVLVALVALPALGIVPVPGWHKSEASGRSGEAPPAGLAAQPVLGDPDGLELAPEVVKRLGLTTAAAEPAASSRPMRLSGTINYDPDYMQRVHALFGGEVIEIAEVEENVRGTTERRKLSFNDHVRKGELLAVVWSKDLGQLKSALVDALVRLRFDEEVLKRYEELWRSGSIPEATYRAEQALVSLDRNTAATAEGNLVVSRVPEAEIQAVKDDADKVFQRRGMRDPAKEKTWARVEVRSRIDGTLVEKNVIVGDTVDTAFNLFVVADLSKLNVWANAYEEDLRALNKLTLPYPWKVRWASDGRSGSAGDAASRLNSDFFEKITPAIDPNQHTATLMGRVEPGINDRGVVGRMVVATIDVPQPGDTVSVPVAALDEDGETSVVFVQPDADRPYFSQRRVVVVQRLSDAVLVSSRLDDAERKRGLSELKQGDRVVTRQTYLLRGTLEDVKNRKDEQAVKGNEK